MIPLPLPRWMRDWPVGLRPSQMFVADGSVRLLFDRAGQPTIEIEIDAEATARLLRPLPAGEQERRLGAAIAKRLVADRTNVAELVNKARTLEIWFEAAKGKDADKVDRELADILDLLLPSPFQTAPSASNLHRAAEQLSEHGGLAASAAALLWLESENPELALSAHREANTERTIASAILDGFAGLPEKARLDASEIAREPLGLEQQRALGRLLIAVDAKAEALAIHRLVAVRSGNPSDWREVARLAVACRRPDAATEAYEQGQNDHAPPEELVHLIDSIFKAGAPEHAYDLLCKLAETLPAPIVVLNLARLELYRGNHVRAADLCRQFEHEVRDETPGPLRIVRAAAQILSGNPADAIDDLDHVLNDEPKNTEALLWRGRAHAELRHLNQMREDLKPGDRFADHPIWQLQRKQAEFMQVRSEERERWTKSPSHLSLLAQIHGFDYIESLMHDDAALSSLLDRTMVELGGNRSRWPTRMVDGRLVEAFDWEAPRSIAVNTQARIRYESPDTVIQALEAAADADRFSPFARTYAAEITLWLGRYEDAEARFEHMWNTTRTRWGYVGTGAARMLQGKYDEALEMWESGKTEYDYLPREATYAYRGELHWRSGDLEAAQRDLKHATETNRSRMGAWAARGIVESELGNQREADEALGELVRVVPALVSEAKQSLGLLPGGSQLTSESKHDVLVRCLEMLRGNRSSSIYTFSDAKGEYRVVGTAQMPVWRDVARHGRIFARDALITYLLTSRIPKPN